MKLTFIYPDTPRPIPALDFEGSAEVETAHVAADWYKGKFTPSYLGRSALIRAVDLKRVKVEGIGRFPGYISRGIIPRLESIFSETGKKQAALGRLSSMAYHESYNHEGESNQRLRLLEDDAELAIDAIRVLAGADPEQIQKMWASRQGIDHVEHATVLAAAVDLSYANPVAYS